MGPPGADTRRRRPRSTDASVVRAAAVEQTTSRSTTVAAVAGLQSVSAFRRRHRTAKMFPAASAEVSVVDVEDRHYVRQLLSGIGVLVGYHGRAKSEKLDYVAPPAVVVLVQLDLDDA
jgi:hypothetical protein